MPPNTPSSKRGALMKSSEAVIVLFFVDVCPIMLPLMLSKTAEANSGVVKPNRCIIFVICFPVGLILILAVFPNLRRRVVCAR